LYTTARNAYEAFFLEGMEKGMEKSRIETILNAHATGLDTPLIASITAITEEEVRPILKEHEKHSEN
jgi:hypothetical protein